MTAVHEAAQTSERASPLVNAAQRLVSRIETLVEEVARLRADNAALRRELQDAVALFETVDVAAAGRAARTNGVADSRRRRRVRARAPKGRATPPEVTSDVVRAVIVKLGEATAAEVAAEINRARAQTATGSRIVPVGGRAVRFLAERAGAVTTVGDDGQRRYRIG